MKNLLNEKSEMMNTKKTDTCIACGKSNLKKVLDLGHQVPANNLLEDRDDRDYTLYPLGINACPDCSHGQLSYFVEPAKMFKQYSYVSSTSQTMKSHMEKLANFVLNLKGSAVSVLEIGSNDGLFLKSLKETGVTNICGVDPAENIASKANEEGLTTIVGFWPEVADEFSSFAFDIVIGQNVFAHTPNPYEALKEIKRVLTQDGFAIFQTSQADMIANGEFDTIYHEHYSFFCEASMASLAERVGLQLVYTHYVDIHGGSSLYVLTHDYLEPDIVSIELSAISSGLINVEAKDDRTARVRKYRTEEDWAKFEKSSIDTSVGVLKVVEEWLDEDKRIVAVGAAAKAITFLRAAQIPIDALLDESPLKLGKWVAGLDTQITDFKNVTDSDAYIIGAWNFAKEIAAKLIHAGADHAAPCMVYFPEGVTTTLGYLALNGLED